MKAGSNWNLLFILGWKQEVKRFIFTICFKKSVKSL